jgi:ATP-binding cassette subfamily A (ABC1) protein 1
MRVSDNIMSILLQLGYCPQFSALWPDATTQETLRLFAIIKGFTGADVDRRVDHFLNQMKIRQYANQQASELSGGIIHILNQCRSYRVPGTQRKLSVAMAMMGNAKVLLLDEPSTGTAPNCPQ